MVVRCNGGTGSAKGRCAPSRKPNKRRKASPAPPPAPAPATRRGTVTDEDGVRFEGWLNDDGELHGRGTMHFPDGGWQSCNWVEGVPNGPGEYVGEDWSIIRGTWLDGDLEGHVEEFAEGGFLVYFGQYQASRRHGSGTLKFRDGSRICGNWEEGTLHGAATFFYPDGVSGLKGLWKKGDMEQAHYFGPTPPEPPLALDKKAKKKAALWPDVVFKADETTETHMGYDLLLRDPYETLVSRHRPIPPVSESAKRGGKSGQNAPFQCPTWSQVRFHSCALAQTPHQPCFEPKGVSRVRCSAAVMCVTYVMRVRVWCMSCMWCVVCVAMQRCRVGRSGLCDTTLEGVAEGNSAGEGLFTRTPIQKDELVCYYNGVRVPHTKVGAT